jgi:uncharacterized small protein (DUF1192 family)
MAEKQDPQVTTVKMDDGRLVEFAGKKQLLKESFVDADGTVKVRLDWRNGETRTFSIPTGLVAKFAAHGAEQKLGDEIAGLKKADGSDADIEDKVLAVDELIDRLNAGEWNTRKESSGMAGTSVLIRALVELYGKSVADVRAFLKDKSQAEKMALRGNARIKPIVERLEAERASKSTSKVDSDALLAGLDG